LPSIVLGIRHGEVENPDNVIYARLPGYHLSRRGAEAAASLADRLSGVPVAGVYASPLERAQETALALAAPHGLTVLTDDRLLEWSFWTRWQGKPWLTVRDEAPDVFVDYADDPGSLCPEDPLRDIGDRVLSWATDAAAAHGGGVVLGVSHEAPLAAALLVGSARPISAFAGAHVPHLGAVRLHPAPVDLVDPLAATENA
jgi:broad specificity phosphatase PhoE